MFIGEIGINHNGDIEIAKQLIDMAVKAGCDVVKFQKRNPEVCVPEKQKKIMKETPWGIMTYLDYKKRMEFDMDDYNKIDRYCRKKQIQWTASVWDLDSLKFILQYDVPFIKVPSAKITDLKLLKAIADSKKDVMMGTGMSTEEEIIDAVRILQGSKLTIMHCNSAYPAPDKDLNLNYLITLKYKFWGHDIGYSGHEEGISASILAATMGAKVIERHITLSRSMWGTDQSASLVYDQLYRLIRDIKKINIWKGDGFKKITSIEESMREKLR